MLIYLVSNGSINNKLLDSHGQETTITTPKINNNIPRTSTNQPFERVEALRLAAEAQFRDTEESLQAELAETERKLTEMQSARQDGELTVLTPEQQEEVQRFVDRKLQIRRELRQVQHDLSRDIEALGMRLKFVNIVLVPVLIVIASLVFGYLRRRRRESDK